MDGLRLVWDPDLVGYDFGRGHPMSPVRLDLTARLCRDLGLLDAPGVHRVGALPASDAVLTTVHTPDYVAAVRRASVPGALPDLERGLGTDDVPVFPGMHEAAARLVTGSRDAALAVWSGEAGHGVNLAGGMHHAMPGAASGFCVYNDAAAAIAALLDAGAERVAYVDVDAHHGDGVQTAFWEDPRVLTISLHESGQTLYPGTGFPGELGPGAAEGTSVNCALPAGTGDAGWLRAFHAVVPPLVRAFAPQVLVTQQGCDGHAADPLTNLALSVDAQRASYVALHELAHEVCAGRWVALGGGGYEVVDVVPRAWAHLVAVAAHRPVPPDAPVPRGWLDYVLQRYGRRAPGRMTDGATLSWKAWNSGADPADPLDRAVLATRRAAFPLHGLDAWFD